MDFEQLIDFAVCVLDQRPTWRLSELSIPPFNDRSLEALLRTLDERGYIEVQLWHIADPNPRPFENPKNLQPLRIESIPWYSPHRSRAATNYSDPEGDEWGVILCKYTGDIAPEVRLTRSGKAHAARLKLGSQADSGSIGERARTEAAKLKLPPQSVPHTHMVTETGTTPDRKRTVENEVAYRRADGSPTGVGDQKVRAASACDPENEIVGTLEHLAIAHDAAELPKSMIGAQTSDDPPPRRPAFELAFDFVATMLQKSLPDSRKRLARFFRERAEGIVPSDKVMQFSLNLLTHEGGATNLYAHLWNSCPADAAKFGVPRVRDQNSAVDEGGTASARRSGWAVPAVPPVPDRERLERARSELTVCLAECKARWLSDGRDPAKLSWFGLADRAAELAAILGFSRPPIEYVSLCPPAPHTLFDANPRWIQLCLVRVNDPVGMIIACVELSAIAPRSEGETSEDVVDLPVNPLTLQRIDAYLESWCRVVSGLDLSTVRYSPGDYGSRRDSLQIGLFRVQLARELDGRGERTRQEELNDALDSEQRMKDGMEAAFHQLAKEHASRYRVVARIGVARVDERDAKAVTPTAACTNSETRLTAGATDGAGPTASPDESPSVPTLPESRHKEEPALHGWQRLQLKPSNAGDNTAVLDGKSHRVGEPAYKMLDELQRSMSRL